MTTNDDKIFNIVIGTAGHIDHGKSSMVQRLTGIDPDRLPEEKSRGLTIDLGFAPLTLKNGLRVGIVDVPGHERLIKNMVAGATGIDLVLLVIAADDGVMPQTREHLTIMQILGLSHGMVVITKIDAVEEEFLELVEEDVRETLEGTFLESSELVKVSSITGEGFEDLEKHLNTLVEKVRPREAGGIFRMPVQRVFSPKGFGTVVTGIPVSGTTQLGDTLEIVPLGEKGRVRGIQAYKEQAETARAGHSAAINLSDIDYRQVHRGMVLTQPGYFTGSTMFEARFHYLPDNHRILKHQATIRLHVGTAEQLGKIYLLDSKRLDPGQESYVQFRFEEPVVAAPGDRYVLRLHSPMETIGGGEIIDSSKYRLKTGKDFVINTLRSKNDALADSRDFLLHQLDKAGLNAVNEADLARQAGLKNEDALELIESLIEEGLARRTSRGGQLLSGSQLNEGREAATKAAAAYFEQNPRRRLMEKAVLRQKIGCSDVFLQELVTLMQDAGEVENAKTGHLKWRDLGPSLSAEEEKDLAEITAACLEGGPTPPSPGALASELGWDSARTTDLFDLLDEEGVLQKIADGIYFHRDAIEGIRRIMRKYLEENEQITAGGAKDLIGSTRKYSIPLLEQLDREGFTVRKGDYRVLNTED